MDHVKLRELELLWFIIYVSAYEREKKEEKVKGAVWVNIWGQIVRKIRKEEREFASFPNESGSLFSSAHLCFLLWE